MGSATVALAVKHFCRKSSFRDLRLLLIGDNTATIGAFSKGHSSSWRLNSIIRRMLRFVVVGGLSLSLVWVGTH